MPADEVKAHQAESSIKRLIFAESANHAARAIAPKDNAKRCKRTFDIKID